MRAGGLGAVLAVPAVLALTEAACSSLALQRQQALADAAHWLRVEREHPSSAARPEIARSLWRAEQRSSATRRYLELLLDAESSADVKFEAAARLGDPGLPVEGERLPELLSRDLSNLPAPVHDRIVHRVALELLRLGRFDEAEAALVGLPDNAAAQYLRAVVRLRAGDRAGARAALELARRLGRAAQKDLATLGLARLAAADSKVSEATRLYEAIAPSSPAFFRARQELAWIDLERGAPGSALAQSALLLAPAWRHFYRPDRELVEAAALLGLCRDRAARLRAEVGRKRLAGLAALLARFLRPRADVRLYYLEAMASAAGHGPLASELSAALLADASFHRAYQLVRQLQREQQLLRGGAAEGLAEMLRAELDARLVVAQRRAGEVTRRLLASLRAELAELQLRLDELVFDLDSRGEQRLIAVRSGKAVSPSKVAGKPIALGRQQQWPMQGEYWLDEQRDFVVRLSSQCPSASPGQ